jgi:alpha-N-arabinofuranosidase
VECGAKTALAAAESARAVLEMPVARRYTRVGTIMQTLSRAILILGLAATAIVVSASGGLFGQGVQGPVLQIDAGRPGARVSPMLYGLMTEEINFCYDGGLYAELVRNRSFKEDAKAPAHWRLVEEGGGSGTMSLDPSQPLNEAIATSLKLTIAQAGGSQRVGVANEGFWGVPVRPGTRYRASFYAKASPGYKGPITVAIVSDEGGAAYASGQISALTGVWKKYELALTASAQAPASAKNHLLISAGGKGAVWFGMVSLFPPTFNNRANGNRKDIAQLLADMKPAFLRFPGGNYLEGNTIETRFDWKKTLGDVSARAGHMNDAWGYWSSDGMGLLEFLEWCEELNMQPVMGVYAGYSMRQQRVKAGPDLEPYVKDALDEIEYATGDKNTAWGARRARDGHPAPFHLEYVEVGNEDQFDNEKGSYEGRFGQFYDAIKAKYPKIKIISSTAAGSRVPDLVDEHYYRRSEDEMASHANDYDARPRTGPKVFVGEYATRVGEPTGNMSAALGDAAWLAGLERNPDLVVMSSYAPLFVNVNPGAMQWRTDLIGFDAMTSYGSPSYYVQKMFNNNRGDVTLPVAAEGIPTRTWQPPAAGRRGGPPAAAPPAREVATLFYSATRDSKAGTIYVKIVNRAGAAQPLRVEVKGVTSVASKGQVIAIAGDSPEDTNSIAAPAKIAPVTSAADDFGTSLNRTFPPYSVTVLRLEAK